MEEFKDTVKIPGGPITEDSIKVSGILKIIIFCTSKLKYITRTCSILVDYNECGTDFEDCSGTICKNKLGSFTCHCPYAHVDVSEDYGLLPGRKCISNKHSSLLSQLLSTTCLPE